MPFLAPPKRRKRGKAKAKADAVGDQVSDVSGGGGARDTRGPTYAVKVVWNDLMAVIHDILITFGGDVGGKGGKKDKREVGEKVVLSEREKRLVGVYDVVVEILKGVVCCGGASESGFDLDEVEGGRYGVVRGVLAGFMKDL